jgi:hypothetical protein
VEPGGRRSLCHLRHKRRFARLRSGHP